MIIVGCFKSFRLHLIYNTLISFTNDYRNKENNPYEPFLSFLQTFEWLFRRTSPLYNRCSRESVTIAG